MADQNIFSSSSVLRAIFFFTLAVLRSSSVKLDLGGTWTINNANGTIVLAGSVPGTVQMALFRNGKIDDPYFRFNDVKYRWIAYDNWTYTKDFQGR